MGYKPTLIPLTKPRLCEFTKLEVAHFFTVISLVTDDELDDIIEGFHPNYRPKDDKAQKILREFVHHRVARDEYYFECLKEFTNRLYLGNPVIIEK